MDDRSADFWGHLQVRWPSDRRGAIAVMFALTSTMTLGVLALAVDAGMAYINRAELQQASDAAALAGGMTYLASSSAVAAEATIQDVVVANGWPSSSIQNPLLAYLTQSPFNTAFGAVQVVLRTTSPIVFGGWIIDGHSFTLQAKSVAQIGGFGAPGSGGRGNGNGAACILSLGFLMVNGTINVSNGNISAQVCAVAADGLITVNAGASINANAIISGVTLPNLLGQLISGTLLSNTTVANPFAGVSASNPYRSCTTLNFNSGTTAPPLSPGCYSLNTSVPVTLNDQSGQPGVYYFTNLNVNSGGSLTGSDVTAIVQTTFSPNGPLNLTAPVSGTYNGIAVYANSGVNFNSGVQWTINGAVYAPNATLILDSNTLNVNACAYIVAGSIIVNAGATIGVPQQGCNAQGPGGNQTMKHPIYGSGTVFLVQ